MLQHRRAEDNIKEVVRKRKRITFRDDDRGIAEASHHAFQRGTAGIRYINIARRYLGIRQDGINVDPIAPAKVENTRRRLQILQPR